MSMDDEYLPDHIQERIALHGEESPYHQELQDELGIDYDDLETWDDLRTVFGYLDDDDLVSMDARDLVPDVYNDDELLRSQSSGTTGAPKEVFYHEDDARASAEHVVEALDRQDIMPEETHWAGTVTPNEVLEYTLEYAADAYDSGIDLVKVENPGKLKGALMTDDKEKQAQALDPFADQIVDVFEENDVTVYEDIAPLMNYVGTQKLSEEHRENVDVLLIGGVGTEQELVDHLTENVFPNADLSGWYGDYMTGFSMIQEPNDLEYAPQRPDIQIEVRDTDDLDEMVDREDDGEVVAHAIRRGYFVPNRRIGDAATRGENNGKETIKDIGRLG